MTKLQGQESLGKGYLQKFFKGGSRGSSFSIRSAITGFVVAMSSLAASGDTIQYPISTQIFDYSGSPHGEIRLASSGVDLTYDGESWLEANSVLFMVLSAKITKMNVPQAISDNKRHENDTHAGNLKVGTLDLKPKIYEKDTCGFRFLKGACRNNVPSVHAGQDKVYGGWEAPYNDDVEEASSLLVSTPSFAF